MKRVNRIGTRPQHLTFLPSGEFVERKEVAFFYELKRHRFKFYIDTGVGCTISIIW